MPFQSEKQRRYLWANEPEIARDWTNTYGSRVKKANGGLGALYEGWEGLGNPFPTAVSQFGNYLTGGEDVTNLADIAPTGPYQDVIQEGILGALNRQSGLNQGDFSRLVKADDYGGHKIGQHFKSADTPVQFASMLPAGLPRELLEMVKVGIGDPTANVANTLGDFQFEYKPPATDFDEDYMGISDRYNFPTSDQGKHGFFPGNKFNMSGEITNADQKREIRDAIFDLQSKQRISNLAKGDPSVMQPHDFEFGDEWATGDTNKGGILDWITNKGTGIRQGLSLANENYLMPAVAGVLGIANRYNPLSEGSQNYNPDLQGQVDMLETPGWFNRLSGEDPSGPYRITSGPLKGKNLVSGFGTNDYGRMLQKRIDYFKNKKSLTETQNRKMHETIAEQMRIEREKSAAQAAAQTRYEASKASGREGGGWYGGADYSGGKSGDVAQAGPGRDPEDRM